ncbi:hypothetical protein HCJ27_11980 [Listeria sp. FSL L7-1435]|uniref:hypothetical protein n=1 Tax=Listeria cossartiae TaxID=2838249 RepID=UPI00162A0ACA|nr:hypothetical protein [Listeria cossartiae]MBC1547819.1 hypothetical protein [Listeria cossartiae subsp. cossartiae]
MKEDILAIYNKFEINNLNMFFDDLIEYVNKYYTVFSKYISLDYLDAITRLDSTSLILGHSDDNFEIAIPFYTNKVIEGLNEEELSNQVSSLIWDLSAYMTEELCPSCNDSDLRLTTIVSREDILVKFCDECLYTGIRNEHVEIEEDLVPAPKKKVEEYLRGT